MTEPAVTSDRVKRIAAELDFALCGITDARPTDHADHVRDWLAAGKHGSMAWLADHPPQRLDPRVMLDGARSIICVADALGPNPQPPAPAPDSGRIARYAQFNDYHKIIKKRLHTLADQLRELAPDEQFRVCVDTAPVLEREHAARAGLGWVGKNTLLIQPRTPFRGSHLMLGEIITTLSLVPDRPEPDHCGTCTRCIDACPTDCITPYSVDASRCLSYLTIEHRGEIDPEFDAPLGDWLFGCDVCQDVCPYNRPGSDHETDPPEAYGSRPATLDLLTVLNWTPDDRIAALTRSAMKRAKLDQFKRNALLVAANQHPPDPALRDRIEQLADDLNESELVRRTAARCRDRLRGRLTD